MQVQIVPSGEQATCAGRRSASQLVERRSTWRARRIRWVRSIFAGPTKAGNPLVLLVPLLGPTLRVAERKRAIASLVAIAEEHHRRSKTRKTGIAATSRGVKLRNDRYEKPCKTTHSEAD
ncbi:hypothetical protein GW17_00059226 [Ensete ventricosum]|nr:hypothetical protein GW17_00059226 [Ensete ventricosum]